MGCAFSTCTTTSNVSNPSASPSDIFGHKDGAHKFQVFPKFQVAQKDSAPKFQVALKLIHGLKCIIYDPTLNDFVLSEEDINVWIYDKFKSKKFTHYINYNDEHTDKVSSTCGHCKGCIAWNDTEICWLVHSVPKFMIHFNAQGHINILNTSIEHSEQIYGQSFIFVSGIPATNLQTILNQVAIMKPFVDTNTSNTTLKTDSTPITTINNITLSPQLDHLAKSPKHHIDIFSDYIQKMYGGKWQCETWRRGHHCDPCADVIDNHAIKFKDVLLHTSSHDHSKYACNNEDLVYIGDLNRMTTQFHRGGGGFIVSDAGLAAAIRGLFQ